MIVIYAKSLKIPKR